MIQNAFSVLGHIHIGKSVAVVVTHGNTLPVAAGGDAGLLGDVGESSVSIVAIERIAQGRIGIVEVALAAVDEIDVHPSVVVVVEKGAACAGGFRQIFLRRLAGGVHPGDAAAGGWHFFEGIGRCSTSEATQGDGSGGACKGPEENAGEIARGYCGHCGFWAPCPPAWSVVCCCRANSRSASSLRPVRE